MLGETAERILEAGRNLLADRGYSGFSYADIAQIVKIRKASIHHHFPTKADLVVAVLETQRIQLEEQLRALDSGFDDPLIRIKGYLKCWEGCADERTPRFSIIAILGAELPSLPIQVQSKVEQHFAILTEWFEGTLKAASRWRLVRLEGTVAAEAQILIATMHGIMLAARVHRNCALFRLSARTALDRISSRS